MASSPSAPEDVTIKYTIPDDATTYEMQISLREPSSAILARARRRHYRTDLFGWAVNNPSELQRDSQLFQAVHKPNNIYHFVPRRIAVRWVYQTKPKLKTAWEPVELNERLTIRNLITLGPPEHRQFNIYRVEVGGQVAGWNDRFVDFVRDSSQPIEALRLFPDSAELEIDIIFITGKGFDRAKISAALNTKIEDLPLADVRSKIVSTMAEGGIRNFVPIFRIFGPGGTPFVDATLADVFTSTTPSARVLYVVGFTKEVSSTTIIEDPGRVTDPAYPVQAFVDPGPFLQEFGCLMAYFARNGHKSRKLLRVLSRYVPFVPFLLSFARILDGAPVTELDIAVMMAGLAAFVTAAWPSIPILCSYEYLGATLSNTVREAGCPDPPIVRVNDDTIGVFYSWAPDAGGRAWAFSDRFPAAGGVNGGPFDPVSPDDARTRTTMTIVRTARERALLVLAKSATDGRQILYSPKQGTTNWEREALTDLPASDRTSQLSIVLLDDSASMLSVAEAIGRRKAVVARELAVAFFGAAAAYGAPSAYGCATFSTAEDLKIQAVLPAVPELSPAGQTPLWKAIGSAVRAFRRNRRALTSARLRIFVITDGEDATDDRPLGVARGLLEERIMLDVVFLSGLEDEGAQLRALAIASGGCAIRPESAEQAAAIVRSEEFVDLRVRGVSGGGRAAFAAAKKWRTFTAVIPRSIPYRQANPLRTIERTVADLTRPRSYCHSKILSEMQICVDDGWVVYSLQSSPLAWHVFVPGPLPGTDRTRVFWDLLVEFPPDFPFSRPTYRFLSIPPLKNVSPIGRVRNSVIDRYHPRQHVATVVRTIRGLFDEADPVGPITGKSAAESPAFDPARYDEMIAAGVTDPWLPLPDLEYMPAVYGEVLTGGDPLPPRAKKADLRVWTYSQISSKKIDGNARDIQGVLITREEKRFFTRA